MPDTPLRVESIRADLVESQHDVAVAVTDADGRLVASAGDPKQVTWWRSAAKPFQALPLVADGAADHFGLGPDALALACASHSSEPMHVALAQRMLAAIGCTEADLACGPHPPLSPAVAEAVIRNGTALTPAWSNCSGKHTGMLAQARHRGWPTAGYECAGHPVQERILDEVARWTGLPRRELLQGVDGCTTVCFALPLQAMALAYARFGTSAAPAATRLRDAMLSHPEMVGGTRRLCTDLVGATEGRVLAKVGAEGVYCAAWPELGLGIALKVRDGDNRSAQVALLAVLRQLSGAASAALPLDALAWYAEPSLRNTRHAQTGQLRAAGALRFHGARGVESMPPSRRPGLS